MGDDTTKIFLNSRGNREGLDPDIAAFLDYVNGLSARGRFTKSIESEVQKIKEHRAPAGSPCTAVKPITTKKTLPP